MRILLATSHSYPPQRVGGSESSTHQLCLMLQTRGFNTAVMARLSLRLPSALHYLGPSARHIGGQVVQDAPFGYPVYRARRPTESIDRILNDAAPDLAIVNSGEPMAIAREFVARGLPTIIYIRDSFFDELGGSVLHDPLVHYVTTSNALGQHFGETFGIWPERIPPILLPELYRVESRRQNVTFVCPQPRKGLATALRLAEMRPDIPFLFQDSWPLTLRERLNRRTKRTHPANVTYGKQTQDMRTVYRDAKIVLMPTPDFEGWGRVVSEAQVSGIPALASNAGGLPEAVGPGGLIVDINAGIGDWAEALSRLWDDDAEYQRVSEQALAHAARPDFVPDALADRVVGTIEAFYQKVRGDQSSVPGRKFSSPT